MGKTQTNREKLAIKNYFLAISDPVNIRSKSAKGCACKLKGKFDIILQI